MFQNRELLTILFCKCFIQKNRLTVFANMSFSLRNDGNSKNYKTRNDERLKKISHVERRKALVAKIGVDTAENDHQNDAEKETNSMSSVAKCTTAEGLAVRLQGIRRREVLCKNAGEQQEMHRYQPSIWSLSSSSAVIHMRYESAT